MSGLVSSSSSDPKSGLRIAPIRSFSFYIYIRTSSDWLGKSEAQQVKSQIQDRNRDDSQWADRVHYPESRVCPTHLGFVQGKITRMFRAWISRIWIGVIQDLNLGPE